MIHSPFHHKRGDSFSLGGTLNIQQDGEPVTSMAGVTLAAQVKTWPALAVVDALSVTAGAYAEGGFPVRFECLNTTAWPLGQLCFDVQIILPGGIVSSSETVVFRVDKDVTA